VPIRGPASPEAPKRMGHPGGAVGSDSTEVRGTNGSSETVGACANPSSIPRCLKNLISGSALNGSPDHIGNAWKRTPEADRFEIDTDWSE